MSPTDKRVQTHSEVSPTVVPVDEALVEQIWRELQGKAARAQIRQLLKEAASEFAHVPITMYVPIFVWRRVREQLMGLG
jgi:hypothetical protein